MRTVSKVVSRLLSCARDEEKADIVIRYNMIMAGGG